MSQIIILGGAGNLGAQLIKVVPNSVSLDRAEFDATKIETLKTKLQELGQISMIINCVAFNDLDSAEDQPDLALQLNAQFPKHLAELCLALNLPLIHFSTGYVFSGTLKAEHLEADIPTPNSAYARSKLQGEKNIQQVGGQLYIIRTNLLFGPQGNSLNSKPSVVDTMLRIGQEKQLLKGITDEQSNFTYTPDLAQAVSNLISHLPTPGIYHLTNEGYGSWYDLAEAIFKTIDWNIVDQIPTEPLPENTIAIVKITGAEFPRKAKRPTSAVIINTKLPKLRPWQEALTEYLTTKG